MYYAIYYPYGINTMSLGDMLIRFKTIEQRKQFVEEKGCSFNIIVCEEVSRDYARKLFPRAFKTEEYITDYGLNRWENNNSLFSQYPCEIWMGNPTGGNYKYMS